MDHRIEALSAGQLAAGLGFPRNTLLSWLHRGYAVASGQNGIEGGGSAGRHRRFSFHATMQIGVANALLMAGMSDAKLAFEAGQRFAFASSYYGADLLRVPGFPLPVALGQTFVIVGGERSATFLDRGERFFLREARATLNAEAVIALEVLPLFIRVCHLFGSDGHAELMAAYATSQPRGSWAVPSEGTD